MENPNRPPKSNGALWAAAGLVIGVIGVLGFTEASATRRERDRSRNTYKSTAAIESRLQTGSQLNTSALGEYIKTSSDGKPILTGNPTYPMTTEERLKKLNEWEKQLGIDSTTDLGSKLPEEPQDTAPKPPSEMKGSIGAQPLPVAPLSIPETSVAPLKPGAKPEKGAVPESKPTPNTKPAPQPMPDAINSGDSAEAVPPDPKEVESDSLHTATMISDADPDSACKKLIAFAKKVAGRGQKIHDFTPKQKPIAALVLFVPNNKYAELLAACESSGASISQQFSGGTSRRRALFQKNAKEAFLSLSKEREKMRDKYEDDAPWVQECEENLLAARTALNELNDVGTGMGAIKILFPE